MASINLRQLRDTKQLKAWLKGWLKAGETAELREREQVLACIVPEKQGKQPMEWPDFEARARGIFGDRVFNAVDQLIEDRAISRY